MSASSPGPYRVLHIFGRMQRGGAETVVLEWMRQIDRSRYRFHFGVLSGRKGPLDAEIRELGGEVHPLRLGRTFPGAFARLLRAQRFDVIHSHVHYFSGLILLLARRHGVPVRIAHFHSLANAGADRPLKKLQNRAMRALLARHATGVVAVCEGVMQAVWGQGWEGDPRCRVIYNGLANPDQFARRVAPDEVRAEFGLAPATPLYIHVGRMVPAKNHPRLLAIFRAIAACDVSARLLLVGPGEAETVRALRGQAAALGLAGKVLFLGERTDVPRLLQAADVMLFPSLREGLPGVVIEACAAGTPVVASNLPGVVEIAGHLPGWVECVPLASADRVWRARALAAFHAARRETPADDVVRRLAASPFSIDRQLKMTRLAWGLE